MLCRRPRSVLPLRAAALLLAASLVLSGCGESGQDDVDAARRRLTEYGGRPTREFVFMRDVYPSDDAPEHVPAARAEALGVVPSSEVLGVVLGGEACAYPIRLLAFHHVVNDTLGGRPVAVTYCVVCSSGLALDPEVDGRRLDFGVDGAWRGVATLYDRQTGSVWLHLTGECVAGPLAGKRLAHLPAGRHTTWADWVRLHPDTTVLAPVLAVLQEPSGMGYGTDERTRSGADGWPGPMAPTLAPADPRLASNALVYGVRVRGAARAYPFATLAGHPLVEELVGGDPISVWFDAASRSAAAWSTRVAGRFLTFHRDADGAVRDEETGSRWTMDGACVEGELSGQALRPVDGVMAEWYGWSAYHRDTTVWSPAEVGTAPANG